jgi:hypothetical protein
MKSESSVLVANKTTNHRLEHSIDVSLQLSLPYASLHRLTEIGTGLRAGKRLMIILDMTMAGGWSITYFAHSCSRTPRRIDKG